MNCKIELIEEYPCNDKMELHKREGQHIQSIDCVNKQIAGRTKQERTRTNAERTKQHQKSWYEQRKKEILENRAVKYICSCGATLRADSRKKHEKRQKASRMAKTTRTTTSGLIKI